MNFFPLQEVGWHVKWRNSEIILFFCDKIFSYVISFYTGFPLWYLYYSEEEQILQMKKYQASPFIKKSICSVVSSSAYLDFVKSVIRSKNPSSVHQLLFYYKHNKKLK